MAFPSWVIGVTLSFGGCAMSNLGINMQKYSHTHLQTTKKTQSVFVHPVWLLGMGLLVIGSIADLISFGFADMSLLAPLGAMTLVINMFFAPCFNREKLSKHDVAATVVIVLGTVLSISFGSKSSKQYTLAELLALYGEPLFIIYAIILGCILCVTFIFLRRVRRKTTLSGFESRAEALTYPTLAGTFGAHSVLFAKSSAEIVKSTISGTNEFVKAASYFLIMLLFFFLFLQMRVLNEGLAKADALIIVPVYQVSWVLMNTVVGMMYFQDYKYMDGPALGLFFIGLAVTLLGVYMLASRELKVKRSMVEDWVISQGAVLVQLDDNVASPTREKDADDNDADTAGIESGDDLLLNQIQIHHSRSSPNDLRGSPNDCSYRYTVLASEEETELGTAASNR